MKKHQSTIFCLAYIWKVVKALSLIHISSLPHIPQMKEKKANSYYYLLYVFVCLYSFSTLHIYQKIVQVTQNITIQHETRREEWKKVISFSSFSSFYYYYFVFTVRNVPCVSVTSACYVFHNKIDIDFCNILCVLWKFKSRVCYVLCDCNGE